MCDRLVMCMRGVQRVSLGIEDLREKREEVNRQIMREEEEKARIQKVSDNEWP